MAKREFWQFLVLILALAIPLAGPSYPAAPERLKLGTGVRLGRQNFLPPLAAEEQGYWKQNGLDVEWVPLTSGAIVQAMATGSIKVGILALQVVLMGTAKGVPAVIVSEVHRRTQWYLWVLVGSPIKRAEDVKGRKVGVSRLGDTTHIYGRVVAKRFGIEKEMKFIGTGGIMEAVAALKTGRVDAIVMGMGTILAQNLAAQVRHVAWVNDYLPKDWVEHVLVVRKDFMKESPDTVRRLVRAILQATNFIRENPGWTMAKLKTILNLSDEAAQYIYYKDLTFTKDGKISRRALENVRSFFIEYGLVSQDEVPPVEAIYTDQFTG